MMQTHSLLNASPIYCSRSSHQRCSMKKQFLKISENSQEAPASESLFKWSCRSQTCNFIKKRPWHLLLLLRLSLAIPEPVDPPEFILRHFWKYWPSFLNFFWRNWVSDTVLCLIYFTLFMYNVEKWPNILKKSWYRKILRVCLVIFNIIHRLSVFPNWIKYASSFPEMVQWKRSFK